MAKKKTEDIPTVEETNPANKYKRFLAMGSVLASHLEDVQPGDVIGVVSKGKTLGATNEYNNFDVKVQRNVVKERLTMYELLSISPDDVRIGDKPLIGVVVDIGKVTTIYGDVRSLTVSTNLDDIRPDAEEPF
jgi:hypothetical protein